MWAPLCMAYQLKGLLMSIRNTLVGTLLAASSLLLVPSAGSAQQAGLRTWSLALAILQGSTTQSVTFQVPACPTTPANQSFHVTDVLVTPVATNGVGVPSITGKWGAYFQLWQSWSSGSQLPWVGQTVDGTQSVSVSLPGGRPMSGTVTVRVNLASAQASVSRFGVNVTGYCTPNTFLVGP